MSEYLQKIIIVGGSAGSFKTVTGIIGALPKNYSHTIIFCLHRLRNIRSGFVEALQINSNIAILEPYDKDIILRGKAYLAPANYHLMFEHGNRFSLSVHDPVNHSRPSIDICFDSAAECFREKVIGVVLSGANVDGSNGLFNIHLFGGQTIVQDPKDCDISTMTKSCIKLFQPDHIFNSDEIITYISKL